MSERERWEGPYLLIAAASSAFGFLALLSIGFPFLIFGAAMFVAYPFRDRRGAMSGILLGTMIGVAVAIAVAPLGCSASARSFAKGKASPAPSRTTCDSMLGITYSGEGSYDPSLWPALTAGTGVGVAAGVVTSYGIRRRSSSPTGKDGL